MDYTGALLITQIINDIGDDSTDTAYRALVLNWGQQGIDKIYRKLGESAFSITKNTLDSVASTNGYSFSATGLISEDVISVRDKGLDRHLSYLDMKSAGDANLDLEATGRPRFYYIYGYSISTGQPLLYFYPIPDAVYNYDVTYKIKTYLLADNSTVIYLPKQLVSTLWHYIKAMAYKHEGNREDSASELALFYDDLGEEKKERTSSGGNRGLRISDLPRTRERFNRNPLSYVQSVSGSSGGLGTVTSIALSTSQSSIITITGSPITDSGTLTINLASQAANLFLASPNGSSGAPTFRAIHINDIPSISLSKISVGSGTALQVVRVNAGQTALEFGTVSSGNTFADDVFAIQDNSDATKQLMFQCSGITTGTIRTLTIQDASGTIALTSNKLSAFAATTSSELAGVISDETGTDKLVFNTSPTLVTPILGDATATSINKVAITSPATSATLTIADGKTLTVNASTTIGSISDQKLVYANGANNLTELTLGTNLSITAGTLNASGGGGSTAFNDIGDSTANGTVANAAYTNEWTFNSIAGATALKLSSTSTAAASNLQVIFEVALSGANSTSTQKTTSGKFTNTHTGTSSTNVAIYGSASGGSNNYGLIIENGSIGFGTTAPYLVINPFDSPTAGTVCQVAGFFSAQRSGHVGLHFYNGGGVAEWLIGQKSASHNIQFSKVISNQQYDMAEISTDGVFSACGISTDIYSAGNSGTALTLNFNNGGIQKVTLTGNCTFTFSNPVAGVTYKIYLAQDATGSRTVTWPATVKWPSATAPTLTTTASKTDIFEFTWDGTNYHANTFGQNYS